MLSRVSRSLRIVSDRIAPTVLLCICLARCSEPMAEQDCADDVLEIDEPDLLPDLPEDSILVETDETALGDGQATHCILEEIYEHVLYAEPGEVPFGAFLVLYREDFCVGRVTSGDRASPSCFEMWWNEVSCNADSARVRIFSPCVFHRKPVQEFEILVSREVQGDGEFPRFSIDGYSFEDLGIARPSETDSACISYDCVSTWPGVELSGD